MKYKTLTRLAVRLMGIYLVVYFGYFILNGLVQIITGYVLTRGVTTAFYVGQVVVASVAMLVAIYLARGGTSVVNYLIPSNRPYCHECGYELTFAASNYCPECGTEHGRPVSQQARAEPRE